MTTPSSSIPPTNPYHIARAYNVQPAPRQPSVAPSSPTRPASQTDGLTLAPTRSDHTPQPQQSSGTRALVGAVVPGHVDFTADTPQPGSASLAFYRHPADRNVAATNISAGSKLDVTG